MKRSNRLVLLIGIFLALLAFVLVLVTMSGGGSGGQTPGKSIEPTTAKIVVAVTDIDLGATITADMVATKEVPVGDKPADSFADTSYVVGQIARMKVTNGQLINSKVLTGASGVVTDIEVPAGFVAMSVQVDQVSGVGTLIKAGDFVDLVSGFNAPEKVMTVITDPTSTNTQDPYALYPADRYNHTTVKVVSQGLQVLGTLLPPPAEGAAPAASGAPADNSTTLNGQQQIVILAVPIQDAEVIKFSQLDGSLSLVLRSAKDCTTKPAEGQTYCPVVATSGMTLQRMVSDRGVLPPQVIQVIQPKPLPGTAQATPKP